VFFGTDRQEAQPQTARFTDLAPETANDLKVGWCQVSVPLPEHHRIGAIERPTFWSINYADWFENPDRHFLIVDRAVLDDEAFWRQFKASVDQSEGKQALLFIHGYNVAFDDAVYRAAQPSLDLKFQGATALYSWPSNGRLLDYVADQQRSLDTVGSFKKFLSELATSSGAQTIHVIAHSMGNNALLHALAELAREQPQYGPHFRQIIMAAPDVDRREFMRLADQFKTAGDHITIYAAQNDKAIEASDRVNGALRVGDATSIVTFNGIDSIDASLIIKGFLKHSYFADERVLDDIERVLSGDVLPRFGLQGVPSDAGARYWRFLP